MKILLVFLFFLIIFTHIPGVALTLTPPGLNEISIGNNAVRVPIGYFVLVRKGSEYCAVKFTEIQKGKTEEDWFAKYESYYQEDKTVDFSNKTVSIKKGELSSSKGFGIGRFAFDFGNKNILCGSMKLGWTTVGWIYFYKSTQKEGDYGIELAPTKWTDITQVDIFDRRLKWYRFDAKREDINIPIDKFWDEKK